MIQAMKTIRAEHCSIAGVLSTLEGLVDCYGRGRLAPDFGRLATILDYLEAFPETFHHPKEEDHLFRAIARRCPEEAPLLDKLREDHATGWSLFTVLKADLEAFRSDPLAFAPFEESAKWYVDLRFEHMRREDRDLLALAVGVLSAGDWAELERAFTRADDPLLGARRGRQFEALRDRITA